MEINTNITFVFHIDKKPIQTVMTPGEPHIIINLASFPLEFEGHLYYLNKPFTPIPIIIGRLRHHDIQKK